LSIEIVGFLHIFRKKLKKGVLTHIHANLAVALLLGLLLFVFGVDLATWNIVRQTRATMFRFLSYASFSILFL